MHTCYMGLLILLLKEQFLKTKNSIKYSQRTATIWNHQSKEFVPVPAREVEMLELLKRAQSQVVVLRRLWAVAQAMQHP